MEQDLQTYISQLLHRSMNTASGSTSALSVHTSQVAGNSSSGFQFNGTYIDNRSSQTQGRLSAEDRVEDLASERPQQQKVKLKSNASARTPLRGIRAPTPQPMLLEPFGSFVIQFGKTIGAIDSAYEKILKNYDRWHSIHVKQQEVAKFKFIQNRIEQYSLKFALYGKHLLSLVDDLSRAPQQSSAAEDSMIAMCRKMDIALRVRQITVTLLGLVVAEVCDKFLVRLPFHLHVE